MKTNKYVEDLRNKISRRIITGISFCKKRTFQFEISECNKPVGQHSQNQGSQKKYCKDSDCHCCKSEECRVGGKWSWKEI